MSQGFLDGDGDAADRLHAVMSQATAHIEAIRVDPGRMRRARRRHRLAEGGAVAGVLSVALVATGIAMQSGGGRSSGPTTTTPPVHAATTAGPTRGGTADLLSPIAVSVYDSDDGSEGESMVAGFLGGGPAWRTNEYCQNYATRAWKPKGTGLVFDLGAPSRIGGATVEVGRPGAELEVWAADPSVKGFPVVRPNQPPAGFEKIGSVAATSGTSTITFADVTTRYVLVWFNGVLPAELNPDNVIKCAHSDGYVYGDAIVAVRFTRG